MAVSLKTFNDFRSLNLLLEDSDLSLKENIYLTQQGLPINNYLFNDDINDLKTKNYTTNTLTSNKKINDFLTFKSLSTYEDIDIVSKLAFSGNSTASASNFLLFDSNSTNSKSGNKLGNINDDNNNFIIDFTEGKVKIKIEDDIHVKTLALDLDDQTIFTFRVIDEDTEDKSNYLFDYSYDEKNDFLSLFTTINDNFFIIGPSVNNNLSANVPTSNTGGTGIIKLSEKNYRANSNNFSNYAFYDFKNDNILSEDTLSGQKFNFLNYIPYEVTALSSDNRYYNTLKFFNLKNQISNENNVNSVLPLQNSTRQKDYTTILNRGITEKENENLLFGYNFFTKEYKFLPDKITKFTLPDDIFPFQKININDTNLASNGSYAAESPYFSDKIFRLLDNNKNNNEEVGDINQIFLLQDDSFLLFENGDGKLLKQRYGFKQEADITGTFLCSWLSGNENNAKWFDRYYFPQSNSLNKAISGNTDQIFTFKSDAQKYFETFGLNDLFYDVESNMLFQPKSTYFYSRLGNKSIEKIIDGYNDKLLKDSFNVTFTGNKLIDQDSIDLKDKSFDTFDLKELSRNNFNLSFDLNLDSLSSLNAYQIIGNLYEDGFSLKNNFYFTPFVIIPNGNRLYFYDENFNLIRRNSYPTLSSIDDVLFLEQNNNIVLVGNSKIVKTSFFGEVLDEKSGTEVSDILDGYNSRYIKDFNQSIILQKSLPDANAQLINLNLNNLTVSSFTSNISSNSIVPNGLGGIKGLSGFSGKVLNDTIGVSISSGNNEVIFETLTGTEGTFSNSISTSNHIYDINVNGGKLYIQSFDGTQAGKIHVFDNTRELLSTFSLTTSCVSGYKLDFINENDNINLLSFSLSSDNSIIVDKFILNNPLSTNAPNDTYILNITSNSLVRNEKLKSYNVNPVGFNFLENKYKDKQDILHFKLNVADFIGFQLSSVEWDDAGPTGYSLFEWNVPPIGLSAWKGSVNETSLEDNGENFELLLPFTNLDIQNRFTFDFNFDGGIIKIFLNGKQKGKLIFNVNKFPIDRVKAPPIFFNCQNIKNQSLFNILSTNSFTNKGGKISNIKIYDNNMSDDLMKYGYLKDVRIDDVVFDITCGSRNNIEEINNLYNYNIPGRKNNNLKIYIKNGKFDDNTKEKIKEFLDIKLKKVLPANVNNIEYDFQLNEI